MLKISISLKPVFVGLDSKGPAHSVGSDQFSNRPNNRCLSAFSSQYIAADNKTCGFRSI